MRHGWGRVVLGVGAAVTATAFTVSGAPLLQRATALTLPPSAAPMQPPEADSPGELDVGVLSSRPETVMGGTVLVRVALPAPIEPHQVRLQANGTDVTESLRPVYLPGDGHVLEGLVKDLPEGKSTLTAWIPDSVAEAESPDSPAPARVVVTNHPGTGPVFSGPHQKPFICQTEDFRLAWEGRLGAPTDEHCSVETAVGYVYRSTGGGFAPLPEGGRLPSDVATTVTSTGEEVPYTVRVETGTANRAVYETAVLHDPREPGPDPWISPEGWNRRLVYKFGGGCPGGWFVQGNRTAGVLDHGMLARGYAVASASLNVFGTNCDDLLAAETMNAVKEKFVLSHGVPDHTLGWGASGGAYQAHQIADNYPGLLDGIVVSQSYPDVGFSTVPAVSDALLLRSYAEAHPSALTREQQRAVSGFGTWVGIGAMADAAARIDPQGVCPAALPAEQRYHPEDNPDGARCDVFSHARNVYGTDPDTGLPRRPLDNVGIQYGLAALLDGTLDVDEFLHLNEHVGGFDQDGRVVPERTTGDAEAIAAAYASGRLLHTGGGLADIPIVDHRPYQDHAANGDIHMRYHSFSTRDRLLAANGTADNHVMLVEAHRSGVFSADQPVAGRALAELDAWVTAASESARAYPGGAPIEHLRQARPEWLADSCWIGDERVVTPQLPLPGGQGDRCANAFPTYGSPRIAAGGPLASDIVKCRLTGFDETAYPVEFDEDQAERAREVFAAGVCDWSEPGEGQRPPKGPWQFF
ncbi:DUF6351 family protein [Nocardiopsis exhalans]|uniref:DUF6351 family protein n=1 Tax=Nocardiopsis exhalans TaxID=163604 RepID=A0ABY5DF33_9ACTN|nr:DUF6351 family protein [Nocardiopsis exhalans]USY22966.1 DUF6351 family protein [Nocardiopsis exhalans]